MLTAKGENPYVGVPVRVTRVSPFRDLIRTVIGPPDLRGKIGSRIRYDRQCVDHVHAEAASADALATGRDRPPIAPSWADELQHIPHGNNLSDMPPVRSMPSSRPPALPVTQRHEKLRLPNYREAEATITAGRFNLSHDACHRYSAFACRGPSMVARKCVQGTR
jgi:hypothetical protein